MTAVCLLLSAPQALAAKDPTVSEVELMRHDRETKMPYLDKSFIRSEINVKKLREKQNFIGDNAKDLEQLIDRAIVAYTPARAARERISLAKRRILAALRSLFPEASFEVNDRKGDLSDSDFNSYGYKFKMRQALFRGGVLWNALLQEKAGLEAAEKEYAAALEDVVNDVAAAYFEYNRSLSVIKSQEEVVAELEKYVKISERKYKEEIISEIEHLNVQSLYSQINYDHETSKQELELALLDLQKLLGLEVEDKIDIKPVYKIEDLLAETRKEEKAGNDAEKAEGKSDKKEDKASDKTDKPEKAEKTNKKEAKKPEEPLTDQGSLSFLAPDAEGKDLNLTQLVDMAYLNRPELQVEAAKLESARLEERMRWGNFLPHADAVLEFGKLGEAFDEIDQRPSLEREFRFSLEFNWNVAGNKIGYTYENSQTAPTVSQFQGGQGSNTRRNTFSVGILDNLKDFVDTKEAEVARLDQITQLEKKEKEIIQEVKKSYFDYQKAKIQVKSSLQRVDYRQRLGQLSKHKLEKNEVQISEYLQAQIDLLQELTTLHKALSDYNTAKAKLNHSVGVRNFLPLLGNGSHE